MLSIVSTVNSLITKTSTSRPILRYLSSHSRFLYNLDSLCNSLSNASISNTSVFGHQQKRMTSSFFNRHSASDIWKSVSSVSAQGKRRGRGKNKGKKIIRDLNKGQVIGIGKANIRWPGLSAPIIRGRELVQQQQLPEDKSILENAYKLRDAGRTFKRQKIPAIDRGWTGGHPEGRKIGPPDPIGDLTFEGFDTVILEQKFVSHMTKKFGRVRRVSVFVLTGNRNGLVGLGEAKSNTATSALRRAKNRAGQQLMYIERYDEHTVLHDFYTRFANSKITVWKKPKGYGLKCHRALKSACELIGISDLQVRVEGGMSTHCVIKSFLLGLLRQKTYTELSEETNLHVVEMSPENNFFPKVLASPVNPIESSDEVPDFNLHVLDNKVYHFKKKWPPFWTRSHLYPIMVRKAENCRSHFNTRIMLRAEYGALKSFLTDQYPECKPFLPPWTKSVKEAKKAAEIEEQKNC